MVTGGGGSAGCWVLSAGCYSPRALSRLLKIWLAVAAVAVGLDLGGYPLIDADEGRNAEVSREMAETNDYAVPRLDGLPYLDKPVVYFAAGAAFMEVLGPTETAARLPAYLFTLATAALIFWFARRTWSVEAAAVATIAFLAMPLTIAFARTVIFDSALTFFIVLAIIAFYIAVETRRKAWTIVAWASMALGVLTKGPIALLLPILVCLPYAIWRKNARALWSFVGLLLFAAIIAPWVWAMSQVIPEFLRYVVVTETAERVATKELQRTGPPWYFIPYLVGGALPWSIAAIASWRALKGRDPRILFLLLWIVVPLIFFSISQSKRPQYILPLMAPVALMVGSAWDSLKTRAVGIAVALLGVVLLVAPFAPQFSKNMKPVVIEPARHAAFGLGIAFLIGGLLAATLRNRAGAILALSIPTLAIPHVTAPLMDALGQRRSAHDLVRQIAPHLTPQSAIIGVEAFSGSMAFYLRRPIVVVSEDASEFTSNYLVRRYDKVLTMPSSPVRTKAWLQKTIDECCDPKIFIVRNDDKPNRYLFESRGMPLIATAAHHVAYKSR